MRKFVLFLAASLVCCTWGNTARGGIGDDLASPVTTRARTTLIIGGLLTATLIALEDQIVDPAQRETVDDRPLGSFSKFGDYGGKLVPNLAYVGGMLIAGASGNEQAYKRAEIMAMATGYSAGVTTVLKYAVREPRPNNGADRKSFPSGHATTAFAFAAVVGAEHGWGWGIPACALASLVAYSRINDNKHYMHDVFAGATLGAAYGLGIHYLRNGEGEGGNLAIIPYWEKAAKGVTLAYRF